eukprot:CAMPEP_0194208804 /NCGR_PEP_ID=MMETSP0156-20130528/7148_1 /TAXON_ID=33649 /ORGANISM="Thalassionema nitzschioides, Strain L26-B" /LENGTH=337 /DNA_ID=CAMNT_0038935841 /DNA_START=63 /DNA_END=1076 /DNA_ORIENTATION=+
MLLALAVLGSAAASNIRVLEEEGYQYIEDFSGYYAKYSTCFKVKIQDNNDDQVEGNSYFYNGKYHAQYNTYAAFKLCEDNSCGEDVCDSSIGYVTELQNYLENNVEYVQGYCNACNNKCGRRLEDNGDDDDEYEVDCDTCANQCDLLNAGGDGEDEANYLECQESFYDGDIQYYQAPACVNGKIVIGVFYDDECTVNTKVEPAIEFNYNTFGTVEGMCAACYGNDEVCENLYEDSLHCNGATPFDENEDSTMCKKFYNNVREVTYATRKRDLNFWGPILTGIFLIFGCGFCAQTYYIRHRNKATVDEKSVSLSKFDHGESGPPGKEQPISNPEIALT